MLTLRRLVLLLTVGVVMHAHAEEPRKVAFVDTGNTGRSLSAEALSTALIAKEGLKVAVISRAVDMDPFDVHPEANVVALLKQRGIDVSSHVAAQVSANDVRHADVILTMTEKHKAKLLALYPEAKDKTFTLSEYATGKSIDVPDAYGQPMEIYQAMFAQLDTYVPVAIQKAAAAK